MPVATENYRALALLPIVVAGLAWSGGGVAQATDGPYSLADDPFFKDAAAGYNARTFYMDVDNPDGSSKEAWTFGGKIYGRTGYWNKLLQLGASYYFSLPLYAPDDRDGTGLLAPGQSSLSVVGEVFARLRYEEALSFTLGRQEINMSPKLAAGVRRNRSDLTYVGLYDNRMVPLTYQGALLEGRVGEPFTYYAGWLDRAKPRNSNNFVSMGEAVGAKGSDSDMWMGGAQFVPTPGAYVQAWYHHVPDVIRIGYLDGDYVIPLEDKRYLRLAGQYTDQRSEGSNELNKGRPFSTHNAQAYGEIGIDALKFYGALSATGHGAAIRMPFTSGPIYTSQVTRTFVNAGEKAWQIGIAADMSALLPGLSGWLDYTSGSDLVDSNTGAALPDETELDLGIVWSHRQKGSFWDGFRARFRYGWVTDKKATGDASTTDLRLDVNLPIRLH